ncbi:phosphatase PAP2 family protein [Kordia sp.]|uniref:phosphatase PAP2 family protein n=1 Tax=Kordia sp. TaxID=1965332 RepID=UPI003B5B88DB
MSKLFSRRISILIGLFFCVSTSIAQVEGSSREIKTEKTIQDTGDIIQIGLPIIAGVATFLEDDRQGTWQFAKSFTLNLGITYALKYAINKRRPDGATDGLAFPSGHTSVSFQSASFIQRRYGWKYGIPAYVLAGFVAYSRIEGIDDRHDGWDVLGGIITGVGSSYLFTTPYKDKFKVTLATGQDQFLVGFVLKF